VADRNSGRVLKAVGIVGILVFGIALRPRTAEAQARGTVQAVATLVDTRASFQGLDAARAAVQRWTNPQTAPRDSVQTVAQVSLAYRRPSASPAAPEQTASPDRGAVVVTVDFLRN
jgi:hypothetical protein